MGRREWGWFGEIVILGWVCGDVLEGEVLLQ